MYEGQRWKNIMKCMPFEEKRLNKWSPPYICQPKFDGVRCRAIPLESPTLVNYVLVSSEENVIFSVPHLNEAFKTLTRYTGQVHEFDGELYRHGLAFEEIVSITSRTENMHPNYRDIQFHLFDVINNDPQYQRQITVENLRGKVEDIQVAPYWVCYSLDDVLGVYDELVNKGYEGIIVRNYAAPYERKRSTQVMKFKPKKEDSYVIIGSEEEIDKAGEPKGSLGALICMSGDGLTFNVGTGFSAQQRQVLWEDRESLVGKVAKIKYQHITTGKGVPRFPVFVEIGENV
jgi:DNA ligase